MSDLETFDEAGNKDIMLVLKIGLVLLIMVLYLAFVSAQTNSLTTKGGIYNNSFEYGTGSETTSGNWIGDKNYGYYFLEAGSGVGQADFNSTTKYLGLQSLKLSQTAGAGSVNVRTIPSATFSVAYQGYLIPLKPSTDYLFSYYVKTNVTSANTGFQATIAKVSSTYAVTTSTDSVISTTANWTKRTVSFTTASTAIGAYIIFTTTDSVMDVYLDDVRLEEVDTVSLSTQQQGRPSITITGVTDTNAIDQSQTTSSATASLGDTPALYRAQQFLPTQKNLTGITFQKCCVIGTYTGNTTISIRPDNAGAPSTTILASKTYSSAEWIALTNYVDTFVNLPAILDANGTNKYWVVFYSDANDNSNFTRLVVKTSNAYTNGLYAYSINGTSWTNLTHDLYFKTHFAKLSSSVDLNVVAPDGTSELVSYDVNGDILTDANITINPNGTGTYRYAPIFKNNISGFKYDYFNDFYDTNIYSYSSLNLDLPFYSAGLRVYYTPVLPNHNLNNYVWEINLPTNCVFDGNIKFTPNTYVNSGRFATIEHSFNKTDWVIDSNQTASSTTPFYIEVDNNNFVYLKWKAGYNNVSMYSFIVDANLSCPSLTTPLFKSGTNTIYTMNKDADNQSGATLTPSLMSNLNFSFTAPTTTFSSFQVPNTTDQNITLTCTSINGCKAINYNINNEGWNFVLNEDIYDFEPSFETITKWDYSENDADNRFTGGQSEDWATNGTYSYKLYYAHSSSGTTLGRYGQVSQKIDFTNINDLNLDYKIVGTGTNVANRFTCRIYIGSTLILNTSCGSNVENNLNYDTSAITGEQDFNIQLYTNSSYQTTTGSVAFYVDNITINQGNYLEDLENYSFLYSGSGDHNIQYFSTDNSGNTETTNFSYFPQFQITQDQPNNRMIFTGTTIYNDYNVTSWQWIVNGTPITGTTDKIKYYSTQANLDLNICLTTNSTDTTCQSSKTWDTINPTIDANITPNTYGFVTNFDLNYNMICYDNFSPIQYTIQANNGTLTTLYDSSDANATLKTGHYDINVGQKAQLIFTCTDDSNNTATYTSIYLYALQFRLINENTGTLFDLNKVVDAEAYSYDGNFIYSFKDANITSKNFFSPSTTIRFDFTYPDTDATKLSREINFDYIEDENVGICVAEYQQFYLYRFLSTSVKPVVLYNDYAKCYNLASTTKFLHNTYQSNSAYTINKPYYLYTYTNGVKSLLALLDGANNTEINLDILAFNQQEYVYSVNTDVLVFSPTTDGNTIKFYFNSPNQNDSVSLNIYNGTTLLWNYTELVDTNAFEINFFYGDLNVTDTNLMRVVVTVVLDGETSTFYKYFNTKAEVYSGLLNPIVAIVFSFLIMFFGITMVSYRFALGWFGLAVSLLAIGILALAPLYDYIIFLQAIYFIIGLFIGVVGKEQNLGVQ